MGLNFQDFAEGEFFWGMSTVQTGAGRMGFNNEIFFFDCVLIDAE